MRLEHHQGRSGLPRRRLGLADADQRLAELQLGLRRANAASTVLRHRRRERGARHLHRIGSRRLLLGSSHAAH